MPTCLPPCLCSFAPHTFNLYRLFEKSEAENPALKQHKSHVASFSCVVHAALQQWGFEPVSSPLTTRNPSCQQTSCLLQLLYDELNSSNFVTDSSAGHLRLPEGPPPLPVRTQAIAAPSPIARCPPHHPTKDEPVVTTTTDDKVEGNARTKSHTMSCLVSLVRQFDVYALAAG